MENIREKIVNLIPSKTLKQEMAKRQTVLKDRDLIALVYQYSPTVKESIELLQQLKPHVKSDRDLHLIDKIIKMRNFQIKKFAAPSKNCVYKIEIFCSNGSKDTFLNKRYDTIIDNLKYWMQYYDDVMGNDTVREIDITKEYLFDKMDEKSMEKSLEFSYCKLTPELEISDVSVGHYSNLASMMDLYRMRLPSFINKYDLVSYVHEGVKHYGIVDYDMKDVSIKNDIAVYELDQPIATYQTFFDEITEWERGTYYDFFMDHQHIKFTDLEREDPQNAPAQIQKNYCYIKECLVKLTNLK